jgi:hypothetical protein
MFTASNTLDYSTMSGDQATTVRENPAELRYELLLDSRRIGEIRYRLERDAVALVHTDIDPAYEGDGLGTQLRGGLAPAGRAAPYPDLSWKPSGAHEAGNGWQRGLNDRGRNQVLKRRSAQLQGRKLGASEGARQWL